MSLKPANNCQQEQLDHEAHVNPGSKYDDEKPRWDLLPLSAITPIVKVLTFGSRKYADNNWKTVDRPVERYYAALMRHLTEWRAGYNDDGESGLPHLAHAGCCIIFLLWFTTTKPFKPQNQNDNQTPTSL